MEPGPPTGPGSTAGPSADTRERLRLRSSVPFPWRARPPAVAHRPAYPGSSVLFEQRWWEVVEVRSEGLERTYLLEPWRDSEPIRQPFELDPASCERHLAAHAESLREAETLRRLEAAFLFLSLLPAEEQRELERRYGLDGSRGTLLTAGFLVAASVAGLLLAFAESQGFPMASGRGVARACLLLSPLLLYFFVENAARLWSALSTGEPMGSALGVVPWTIWRTVRGRTTPNETGRAPASDPWSVGLRGLDGTWATASDRIEVLPVDEQGRARLRVHSRLPKNHWRQNTHAIDYGPIRYLLAERRGPDERPGPDDRARAETYDEPYSFDLVQVGPEILMRHCHAYHPEEVREIYKARRRMRTATWVETFAFLWATVREQLQLELAELYPYRLWRAGVQSMVVFGLVAFLGTVQTGLALARDEAGAVHLLLGASCFVLAWDTAVRALRYSRGQVPSSAFGFLFEPFVRSALRWQRSPHWPYPDTEV